MNSASLQDWVFWLSGVILALAGLTLAAWALFWDRSRGRKRCPRCWYDMSGAVATVKDGREGFVCPECGSASGERGLRRTRRRWRWAAVGLAVVLAGYGVRVRRAVHDRGWVAAIPSVVFVYLWPFDEIAWLRSELDQTPILHEFDERLRYDRAKVHREDNFDNSGWLVASMGDWLRIAWIERVQRTWNRRFGPDAPTRLGVYSFKSILEEAAQVMGSDHFGSNYSVASFQSAVQVRVDVDHWADNGGTVGHMARLGGWMLVETTPQNQKRVASAVEECRAAVRAWCRENSGRGESESELWGSYGDLLLSLEAAGQKGE